MEINVALTNLGKYNEGELVYEWLTLPAEKDDLVQAMLDIGIDNAEYEEFFISDYEAPFRIGEYDNLDELNEMAEVIDVIPEVKENFYGVDLYDVERVIGLASELEAAGALRDGTEIVGDIVDGDELDEMARQQLEDGGWERVAIFLGNASMTNEYHYIDGYGNIDRLTNDILETKVKEMLEEAYRNI